MKFATFLSKMLVSAVVGQIHEFCKSRHDKFILLLFLYFHLYKQFFAYRYYHQVPGCKEMIVDNCLPLRKTTI